MKRANEGERGSSEARSRVWGFPQERRPIRRQIAMSEPTYIRQEKRIPSHALSRYYCPREEGSELATLIMTKHWICHSVQCCCKFGTTSGTGPWLFARFKRDRCVQVAKKQATTRDISVCSVQTWWIQFIQGENNGAKISRFETTQVALPTITGLFHTRET